MQVGLFSLLPSWRFQISHCYATAIGFLAWFWIKEMFSGRESRVAPHGCRCERFRACLACEPLELPRTESLPSELPRQEENGRHFVRRIEKHFLKLSYSAWKNLKADAATWERGMQHVLARFWARRSGRGWKNLFCLSFLLPFLCCFTPVAATPSVVSLRFQTGLQSTDTTIDANESVGEVRIDSEVRTKSKLNFKVRKYVKIEKESERKNLKERIWKEGAERLKWTQWRNACWFPAIYMQRPRKPLLITMQKIPSRKINGLISLSGAPDFWRRHHTVNWPGWSHGD